MNGEQELWRYFMHTQNDLNMRILRMLEGPFSLEAAHLTDKIYLKNILHLLQRMEINIARGLSI